MLNRASIAIIALLLATGALAQPLQPANITTDQSVTPEVVQVLDQAGQWAPMGTLNSTTHVFTPVGGGGAGAGGYPTHAALVAAAIAPAGDGSTLSQQGFYAAGDGGATTYQWSATSYCANGTTGTPTTADGVTCILPSGQAPSTAGRYLLQHGNGIDVRSIGMKADGAGGFDNSPLVPTLMAAISLNSLPINGASKVDVLFPPILGPVHTDYYFTQTFHMSRRAIIVCPGTPNGGGDSGTRLVFADGVHGVEFDNNATSPDGTTGGGGMRGCGVVNTGRYQGITTNGSATITGVGLNQGWPVWSNPYTNNFQPGDGVLIFPVYKPPNGAPLVAPGAYLASVNAGAQTITMASPYVALGTYGQGNPIWRLPAAKAFTVQTTIGSNSVMVTAGPSRLLPGDYVWSDAFPFGTPILTVTGTVGAQTVTMGQWHMDNGSPTNATVTHTAGSPGKLWIIPAAIKAFVATNLQSNTLSYFPWGLEMECSSWGNPIAGCNGSYAQQNSMSEGLMGRLVLGENSGASTSISNVYAHNSIADVGEFGSVGSTYIGDNGNSAESSNASYGLVTNCTAGNFSSYFSMYMSINDATTGSCFNGFGNAVTGGGNQIWYGPLQSAPPGVHQIANATFTNDWVFDGAGGDTCVDDINGNWIISFAANGNNCGQGMMLKGNAGYYQWNYGGSNSSPMWLTKGASGGYGGWVNGNQSLPVFFEGLLLFDTETGLYTPGPERMLDSGDSIPVGTFHKRGDVHLNHSASSGGSAGWIDTADGANFKPFGAVALDTAGTQWKLGSYLTLTPVALASLPATCTAGTFAVINNGVASPTYNAAVGSTTGAATDPVFCSNGNVWTYH